MRIALDTNILAYAEGVNDDTRRLQAMRVLESLPENSICIPVQILGELLNVLLKEGFSRHRALQAVQVWRESYPSLPTFPEVFDGALDLIQAHRTSVWDAMIVCASVAGGCALLLSEDMQHGFVWRGLTIVNPLLPEPHPLLASVLRDAR